jgi:hypothetical protein
MNVVDDILGALKKVAVHPVPMDVLADLRPRGKWRRRALAEVGEDESDRLPCRIRRDLHLVAEGLRLGGLRRASTRRVESPTVVSAGDFLALDDAGG